MSNKKCQVRVSSKSVLQECLTRVSSKSVLRECQVRSVKQGCPTRVSPQCVNSGCLTSEFAGNVTNKYCLCLSTYVSAFGFVGFILFCISAYGRYYRPLHHPETHPPPYPMCAVEGSSMCPHKSVFNVRR